MKLNVKGFAHNVLPLAFVVIFAIAGVAYLVASHAASNAPYAVVTNTGKGASPQTTISSRTTSQVGSVNIGNDVNKIKAVGGQRNWGWLFCGSANRTQHGDTIYKVRGAQEDSVYAGPSGLSASRTYNLSGSRCTWFHLSSTGTTTYNLCNKYVAVKVNGDYGHSGSFYWGIKACTLNNASLIFQLRH